MIEIRGLARRFGRKRVLDGLDLDCVLATVLFRLVFL